MPPIEELAAQILRRRCEGDSLGFRTTEEIDESPEPFGQQRALEAARFGFGIQQDGFNVFAMGPSGLGKRTVVSSLLFERAATEPTPPDWPLGREADDMTGGLAAQGPSRWGSA